MKSFKFDAEYETGGTLIEDIESQIKSQIKRRYGKGFSADDIQDYSIRIEVTVYVKDR